MTKSIPTNLILRYGILLLLGLGNLYIIYTIFTPLTIYPVFWLLNLFYNPTLANTTITLSNKIIELIPACIAGSAYYFLLILNLSTPMKIKQRVNSLIFLLISFLILNILRITILSIFFINSLSFFDISHKVAWYSLSTIFVVGIWFTSVKIFSIKQIPIYSDLKQLTKEIRN
jgi:exosortase/archaeosortase family protein